MSFWRREGVWLHPITKLSENFSFGEKLSIYILRFEYLFSFSFNTHYGS